MKLKKRNKSANLTTLYREPYFISMPPAPWSPGMGDHRYPWDL